MRRQKRNAAQRTFNKGYHAGINGKSKTACPSMANDQRQTWLNGWREGREDNWNGFTGVSGIHRLPGIST